MAVERHLVGAGRLGDRLDPDAANAAPVEQILRAGDNSFARRLRLVAPRLVSLVPVVLRNVFRHGP